MLEFRSAIFIPGANEKMLSKATSLIADLILYDLEDSVLESKKEVARGLVAASLQQPRFKNKRIGVRLNALSTDHTLADLRAVLPAKPDLVMLPKVESGEDLEKIDAMLSGVEAEAKLEFGSTKLILLTAETPGSLFRFDSLFNVSDRLLAMTWGPEDLATELGAAQGRDENGQWLPPFQLAQSLCLAKASDLQVQSIDTVLPNFRDLDALKQECLAAKQLGFTGKLAIHPSQLETINAVFSPSQDEIEFAQKVVNLFSENPYAGALQIEGAMVDIPHLTAAKRLLARSKNIAESEQ
jgi:citrate lyase subunit beta/citryl-CoA lyase